MPYRIISPEDSSMHASWWNFDGNFDFNFNLNKTLTLTLTLTETGALMRRIEKLSDLFLHST